MNVTLLASALSFVLIDVSLALMALVVGFVSALWYVKISQGTGAGQDAIDEREKEVQKKTTPNVLIWRPINYGIWLTIWSSMLTSIVIRLS